MDTLQETDPNVLADKIKELNIMHALGFHLMQMGVPFGYNMAHPWVGNWWGEVDLGHSLPLPVWSRVPDRREYEVGRREARLLKISDPPHDCSLECGVGSLYRSRHLAREGPDG